MSLSDLQAQLAGLNDAAGLTGNKNVGSIQPSSKRQEDAIGRGMHHSVHHGQSLLNLNSPKFKPSVLYEDSKAANDVPLSTLWENCQEALTELASIYQPLSSYITVTKDDLLKRTSTSGKNPPSLTQILYILSTLIPHQSDNCLHILEYLLRRYNIHIHAADTLLVILLPHCEKLPLVFHRVLQLVNIASVNHFLWLRPYSVKTVRFPPRQVVAANTIKNTALLHQVLAYTKKIASLGSHRGIQQILSWSAAVVVQGLVHLQTVEIGNNSNKESVLRVLLPFLLTACSSNTDENTMVDWVVWGHVVASAVSETMELSKQVKSAIMNKMAVGAGKRLQNMNASSDEGDSTKVEMVADSLTAILAVGLPKDSDETLVWNASIDTWKDYIWLSHSTFEELLSLDDEVVPQALSVLYQDRNLAIDSLLVCIIMMAVLHSPDDAEDVLKALMQQPALKPLFQNVAKALADWIVANFYHCSVKDEDESGSIMSLPLCQLVLTELRRIGAKACEEGIAHALEECTKKQLVSALLEGVLGIDTAGENADSEAEARHAKWLPPRVALEHPDVAVRLQAIDRLAKEDLEDVHMEDAEDDNAGEKLEVSLLRRMASDDNDQVVLEAAKVVFVIFNEKKRDAMLGVTQTQYALETLYQWSSFNAQERHPKITQLCLQILGRVDSQTQLVMEALTAHLGHPNSEVVSAAGVSLCQILGESVPKGGKKTLDQTKKLLVRQHDFMLGLQAGITLGDSNLSGNKQIEISWRERSLWILLQMMTDALQQKETVGKDKLSVCQDALGGCLHILSSSDAASLSDDKDSIEVLRKCLSICIRIVSDNTPEGLPKAMVQLASTPFKNGCKELIQDAIDIALKHVKDSKGKTVSIYPLLMECALQDGASKLGIQRLISVTESYVQDKKQSSLWYCIIPALALLEHSDKTVRVASIDLLSCIRDNFPTTKEATKWQCLKGLCEQVVKNKASASLGGQDFLSLCLRSSLRDHKNPDDIRNCLLTLCSASATAYARENLVPLKDLPLVDGAWMPVGQASGSAKAAMIVLDAMEQAGEVAFPLSTRWESFGQPILNLLLDTAVESEDVPVVLSMLSDSVVKLLKGVAVTDFNPQGNVVISSGPSSTGRRKRSYSVGKSDGVTFIEPYPEKMRVALVDILSVAGPEQDILAQKLCGAVISTVLGSEPWAQDVFPKFLEKERNKIARHLLTILGDSSLRFPTKIFYNLPLRASDIVNLLKDITDLASVSILADYVRANTASLLKSNNPAELLSVLFDMLKTYSEGDVSDEQEFVRRSFLSAMLDLMQADNTLMKLSKANVARWVDLLLALNGSEVSAGPIRPFGSQRARTMVLSLLTSLCSHFPDTVVSSLVPALVTVVTSMEEVANADTVFNCTRSTFDSVAPVFLKHSASAGLSFSDLLSAFVASAQSISSEEKRINIYRSFVSAITESTVDKHDNAMMGAVVASFFAKEIFSAISDGRTLTKQIQYLSDFSLQIFETSPGSIQVSSLLLLLNYADSLFSMLGNPDDKPTSEMSSTSLASTEDHLPTAKSILDIALSGPSTEAGTKKAKRQQSSSYVQHKRDTIMHLIEAILITTNEALMTEVVRRFIRRSERVNTELCLRLWQDLLVVQSTASRRAQDVDGNSDFFESAIRLAGESLEHVQTILPLPTFLASATSLIMDGETEYLRADAIRLVADRAPEVRPNTPEASLFLEMVALLVDILKNPSTISKAKGDQLAILQQSALVAIEHIARAHSTAFSSEKLPSSQVSLFMSALEGCSTLVIQVCGDSKNTAKLEYKKLEDSDIKLLCSLALCSATLVRVTAPRCLPLLPKFVPQMIACLSSVNEFVASVHDSDNENAANQARMVQICLLRALASVAEKLPQFVLPYLKQLFAPSALPSEALRIALGEQNMSIKYAAETLEKSLCAHVPARVLLPVAAKAVTSLRKPGEFEVVLRVLKHSIDASSGDELAGQLGALLKAVTTTYDHECTEVGDRTTLLETANEAVLAMVMRLSEVHLRRLYAILRDWRGALDTTESEKFALRRHAFWSVSADLSKELRTIFLPCLGSVLTDAVEELVSTSFIWNIFDSFEPFLTAFIL